MISLQIQDSDIVLEVSVLQVPITLTSIINETDVETIDGNISTYYSSTKREYSFKLGYVDAETYSQILGFRDRQYQNLKYPMITVGNSPNMNVTNMTAKMSVNDQQVIDNCGWVENVVLTFRESKQMP